MKEEFIRLREEIFKVLDSLSDHRAIEDLRIKYLGRKGRLTQLIRRIGDLDPQERPFIGRLANQIKEEIEERFRKLAPPSRPLKEPIDVTLPGRRFPMGVAHILSQTFDEIVRIFIGMGYSLETGPEIELDYYNFEALNFPKDHPARDMQDTFYISENVVLRTHTSPIQIRVMERKLPPVKIICPGKVYRHDADPSHSPMFHQVEGLLVDEGITFGDLKGTLTTFVQEMFGSDTPLRFRPSFFPFTEPSAEVDIQCVMCQGKGCPLCKYSGWLEILGSGMVDPAVYEFVGIDRYNPEKISGFAFGLGVERIAMLKHGISDIRLFFENDIRFLHQFV
jgi:phenylalanyl-tRNA synthetase alpha chain